MRNENEMISRRHIAAYWNEPLMHLKKSAMTVSSKPLLGQRTNFLGEMVATRMAKVAECNEKEDLKLINHDKQAGVKLINYNQFKAEGSNVVVTLTSVWGQFKSMSLNTLN